MICYINAFKNFKIEFKIHHVLLELYLYLVTYTYISHIYVYIPYYTILIDSKYMYYISYRAVLPSKRKPKLIIRNWIYLLFFGVCSNIVVYFFKSIYIYLYDLYSYSTTLSEWHYYLPLINYWDFLISGRAMGGNLIWIRLKQQSIITLHLSISNIASLKKQNTLLVSERVAPE